MTPLVTRTPVCLWLLLTAALIVALIPAPAAAQEGDIDATSQGQVGPLGLRPKIGWQTEYDDNVYRSTVNPISDFVSTVSFTTDVRSRLKRVGLTGNAGGDWIHYATLERERGADLGTALKVDFLLNRIAPYVSTSYHTFRRRLNPEIDSRPRTRQSSIAAGTVVRVGAKTSLDFSAGRSTLYYEEHALLGDVSLSDALNHASDNFSLSFVQEVTPLTRLSVSSEMRRELYDVSLRRSNDYMRLSAGFDSTGRLRGHGRVGVRILKPHDQILQESRGLFVAVGTSATVRDRLEISVNADRDTAPSYRPDIAHYELYGYGLGLSYAMRRSLRVSVTADRRYADYRTIDTRPSATKTADLELLKSYGSGITYLLGSSMSFNVAGTYMKRASYFSPRRFDGMNLRAGVSHAF